MAYIIHGYDMTAKLCADSVIVDQRFEEIQTWIINYSKLLIPD